MVIQLGNGRFPDGERHADVGGEEKKMKSGKANT